MAGETHSFAGDFFANAFHLEHNRASFDLGDVVFRVAFTAAHFQAQSFFGDWRVRENTNPNLTAALDVASHRLAGRLDLAAGNTLVVKALQTIIAKRDIVAARGVTAVFADADFAVSNFFW